VNDIKLKILITGPPRSGKSILISRLIDHLQKSFKIHGFLTPEIRKNNKREGFHVEDICTKKRFPLARVGNYNTNFRLGKYSVFVEEFENYIKKFSDPIEQMPNLIFCIDEIGKMELFSEVFQEFVKKLFLSNIFIIATIGEKIKHPLKDFILNSTKSILFNLTHKNQDLIFNKIISIIK